MIKNVIKSKNENKNLNSCFGLFDISSLCTKTGKRKISTVLADYRKRDSHAKGFSYQRVDE